MRNCYIRNCDSYCRDMPKRMMFYAPKEDAYFEKWKSVLPKCKREFRKTDKLCERHFNKEDIITTWEHMIHGVLHKLERHKPRLKPTAVPVLHLDIEEKFKSTKTSRAPIKKKIPKKKIEQPNNNIISENGKIIEIDSIDENKKFNDNIVAEEVFHLILTNSDSKDKDELSSSNHVFHIIERPIESIELNDEQAQEKFDALYDDIYEVTLPNTLWGLHRDPDRQFIVFSKFDFKLMNSERIFMIQNNLFTKSIIKNKVLTSQKISNVDYDEISANLHVMDKIQLCETHEINAECLIICEDDNKLCSNCLEIS